MSFRNRAAPLLLRIQLGQFAQRMPDVNIILQHFQSPSF
jgi:hypothetical protein